MKIRVLIVTLMLCVASSGAVQANQQEINRLVALINQSVAFANQNNWQAAEAPAVESYNLARQYLGDRHPSTFQILDSLTKVYVRVNKAQKAVQMLVPAIPVADSVLGRDNATAIAFRATLSTAYDSLGQQDLAIPINEEVYQSYTRLLGPNARDTILSGANLVTSLLNAGQNARAEPILSELERIAGPALGPNDPVTQQVATLRSMVRIGAGDVTAALPDLERNFATVSQQYQVQSREYQSAQIALGVAYLGQGATEKAAPLLERAAKSAEAVFGPDDVSTILAYEGWGLVLGHLSRNAEAERYLKLVYEKRLELLGEGNQNTLKALSNLALLYNESGQVAKAGPALEQAYQTILRHLGPDSETTLIALVNLATFQLQAGQVQEAGFVLEDTYSKISATRKSDDPVMLRLKNLLGNYYDTSGDPKKALEMHAEVYEARRKVLSPGDRELLTTIYNLAASLQSTGDFNRAVEFLSSVLPAIEAAGSADVSMISNIKASLANAKMSAGDLDGAIDQFVGTIADMNRSVGKEHPQTLSMRKLYADALSAKGDAASALGELDELLLIYDRRFEPTDLAALQARSSRIGVLRALGRMSEAESDSRALLAVQRQVLGSDHLYTLLTQGGLAAILSANNQLKEASALSQDALQRARRTMGDANPQTQQMYSVQANILEAKEEFTAAADLYTDMIRTLQTEFGPNHTLVISAESNLAALKMKMGDNIGAQTLTLQVLDRAKVSLGPDHPITMALTNNAGALAFNLGDFASALQMHQSAFDYRVKTFGAYHPDTILSQINLGTAHILKGDIDGAVGIIQGSVEASLKWADIEAGLADEKSGQKRALENARRAERMSYSLAALLPDSRTATLAANVALSTKARLGEREQAMLQAIRNPKRPEVVLFGEQYLAARREVQEAFERMVAAPEASKPAASDAFNAALSKADAIESQLSAFLPSDTLNQPVSSALGKVQARLGAQDVFVEYIVYFPEEANGSLRIEEPHYGAILIKKAQAPAFITLGPRSEVLPLIEALRSDMGKGDEGYFASIDLHTKLIQPLMRHVKGETRLFISPADTISMVPFDLLYSSDDVPLLDQFEQVRFLTSGRAFYAEAGVASGDVVIFGDIDYDVVSSDPRPRPDPAPTLLARADLEQGDSRLRASPFGNFAELPATAWEIDRIAEIMRARDGAYPQLYSRDNASEQTLTAVSRPRVLHLATHGFVRDDAEYNSERSALRTGIVLAGANAPDGRTVANDGVLYGYDIEALDLQGTELVVLSACETGVGTSDLNEGVYNLARAFKLAGAQSVLVTLVPVDDQRAAQFVADFYQEWLGQGDNDPASALAKVKSDWHQADRDPAIWGAFALIENQVS